MPAGRGADQPGADAALAAAQAELIRAWLGASGDGKFARLGAPRDWEAPRLTAPGGGEVPRLVELAICADDLSRSRPDRPAVPFAAGVLRRCARLLARMIEQQAPGHAVELRIPPAVAVQIVEGPRHTRGTPPNVVETDPLTWLRLAAGRATFAEQVRTGAVRASGSRADLSALLPLLR
ncbi:MAG: sterol carrier family protein [Frankiaceae bacterium]|jgi:hypothetical protein|nr:sterol carrier family protein [Frankiaceae bacterium]